jgi:hypothetical protein
VPSKLDGRTDQLPELPRLQAAAMDRRIPPIPDEQGLLFQTDEPAATFPFAKTTCHDPASALSKRKGIFE